MNWELHCQELQAQLQTLEAENASLRARLGLSPGIEAAPPAVEPHLLAPRPQGIHSRSTPQEKIMLFRALFRGRADVFALRWCSEKTEKSGYSPVCANEWRSGICIKPKGSCTKCDSRRLVALSDEAIYRHLTGKDLLGRDVIGLYPMETDESCCLLAMDFDEEDWQESVGAVRAVCCEQGLCCAVERSRSGQGAHLWLFFENPVSCAMARKLGSGLLTLAMDRSSSMKFSSYDRMFPSQDTLPAGGFGNLIALPLQGQARKAGNSVFLDEALQPYPDQWAFLASLLPLSTARIEENVKLLCYEGALGPLETAEEDSANSPKPWQKKTRRPLSPLDFGSALHITKANLLYLPTSGLSSRARSWILRLASFQNPDFYRAQARRFPTYGKPRIICTAQEADGYLALPRGCEEKLHKLLDAAAALYTVVEETTLGRPLRASFSGTLREEQQQAAEAMLAWEHGVLSATTAFGKTVIAAYMIAQRKTNTLILVHTQALLNQWKEALSQFLSIDEELPPQPKGRGRKKEQSLIGQLGGTRNSLAGFVDIAIVQSLVNGDAVRQLVKDYGMVIVDECHHVSAVSFEKVLREVGAKYVYGLTATPTRQDGHQAIIYMQCGPIRYHVNAKQQAEKRAFTHALLPRFTSFAQPLTTQPRWTITEVYREMAENGPRNQKIVDDVREALSQGRTPLVLTERYAHGQLLAQLLSTDCQRVILLSGKGTAKEKRQLLNDLNALAPTEKLVIVATGRYVGEGFDFPRLDTLFLAMPIAWKGTLTQYVGRLHRSYVGKEEVLVYDYVDLRVAMLERMYHKRLAGYAALGYAVKADLTQPPEEAEVIFDSSNYLAPLEADFGRARREIILAGPYLHLSRVRELLLWLSQREESGAKVRVITAAPSARQKSVDNAQAAAIALLREAGIFVDCRPEFYQRFAIMDQELLWYGGINFLGYDHGEEGAIRFHSPELAGELLESLR